MDAVNEIKRSYTHDKTNFSLHKGSKIFIKNIQMWPISQSTTTCRAILKLCFTAKAEVRRKHCNLGLFLVMLTLILSKSRYKIEIRRRKRKFSKLSSNHVFFSTFNKKNPKNTPFSKILPTILHILKYQTAYRLRIFHKRLTKITRKLNDRTRKYR